jgi:predicted nucleic acid-binding Zn ribbon protein
MADARPLAEVLAEYVRASGLSRRYAMKDILAAWLDAVGADAARHCQVTGVRKGVLHVIVDSAACLHELANFRKKEILAEFVKHRGCEKVYDVDFRLGRLEQNG